jgi:putative redox protein
LLLDLELFFFFFFLHQTKANLLQLKRNHRRNMLAIASVRQGLGRRAAGAAAFACRSFGAKSEVVVTSAMNKKEEPSSPFLNEIIVNGRHTSLVDEPKSVGGQDAGPSPYDLLLAALGSCTSMTLRMYADRKELPLTGISVTLTHDKVHKKDCEECADHVVSSNKKASPVFDRIERKITLYGDDLSDTERTRMLEIANKCPVHRTLEHGQVVVVSSLANK